MEWIDMDIDYSIQSWTMPNQYSVYICWYTKQITTLTPMPIHWTRCDRCKWKSKICIWRKDKKSWHIYFFKNISVKWVQNLLCINAHDQCFIINYDLRKVTAQNKYLTFCYPTLGFNYRSMHYESAKVM